MSKPENLKDLYIDELKDLWSANDQMVRSVKKFAPKISDATLKDPVAKWQDGISGHTTLLKTLRESNHAANVTQTGAWRFLTVLRKVAQDERQVLRDVTGGLAFVHAQLGRDLCDGAGSQY